MTTPQLMILGLLGAVIAAMAALIWVILACAAATLRRASCTSLHDG